MPPGVAVCGYISFLMMMMTVVAQLKVICYLLHHKVPFLSSKPGQGRDSEILQMFFLQWTPLSHLYLSLAWWLLSASMVLLTFTAVRKRASPRFIDCFCKWTCVCFVRLLTVHRCHCWVAQVVLDFNTGSLCPPGASRHHLWHPGPSRLIQCILQWPQFLLWEKGVHTLEIRVPAGRGGWPPTCLPRMPAFPGRQVQGGHSPRRSAHCCGVSLPLGLSLNKVRRCTCVWSHTCTHLDIYFCATLVPPLAA